MDQVDNVFVLGAGFSAAAGIPVMSRFMESSRALYGREQRSQDLRVQSRALRFKNVFDFLREFQDALDKISIEKDNIEQVYSLFEARCMFAPSMNESLRRDMLFLMAETIRKSSAPAASPTLYHFFVRLLSGEIRPLGEETSDWVLTFNYDELLEGAAEELGVPVDFGDGGMNEGEGSAVSGPRLKLMKLHGSLGWVRCTGCRYMGKIVSEFTDHYEQKYLCPSCGQDGEPFIVPPSWNKLQTPGFPTIRGLWSRAYDVLRRARRIFVIGYSLPESDLYFRHLLMCALQENKHALETLVFCDTSGHEIKSRCARFLARDPHVFFKVYGAHAAHFLPELVASGYYSKDKASSHWV